MITRNIGRTALLAALLFAGITGCGRETVNSAPPLVGAITPGNGSIGVPVNQALTATFSEPMSPSSINNTSFTLTGPGGVQVGGLVAYTSSGSFATFTPSANLAYNSLYTATVTTGAANTLGVEPASNYTSTFTTAVQPTVLSTAPASGATGVPVNQVLSVTFSKAVNCATLSPTTFTVTGPGAIAVTGTVGCSGSVATFTPGGGVFAANTLFSATITTGVTDTAIPADPLAANYTWAFRTVTAVGPLAVISTAPANAATSVPTNQAITATFSNALNAATIIASTFTLKTTVGGVVVSGPVTYVVAGSVATLTPPSLAAGTQYTATITTAVTDLAGNVLASNYVWTFTTAAIANTTMPTVASTIPLTAATNVPISQTLSATFSKAMSAATINATTFSLAGPGTTAVAGQVTYASIGDTATFTPTANLAASTLYTATITTAVADLEGNAMAANYVWTFTTGTVGNAIKPEVVSTVPGNGATGVVLNQAISATFTAAMNPLTITTATFQLTGPGSTVITGMVSYDPINFIATFTPSVPLTASSSYTAVLTTGANDLSGNPLGTTGAPNPWTFTTGTALAIASVNMGTAALFGDFGGTAGMTNSGNLTVINGNIGTTAVSTGVVDLHDTAGCSYSETPVYTGGLVNGTIYTAAPPPTLQCTPNEGTGVTAAVAAQTAADALTAYNTLVAFPNGLDVSVCPGCGGGGAGELGTRTLAPGIYKSAPGYYNLTLGDLTLDAQGNANATWVFQMASYLTVGSPTAHRSVLLVNGAQAKNVFWQVGSFATINGILGGGTMSGTIIAQQGASVSTVGVAAVTTINGRVLSLGPSVTIVNTVINVPTP
jgi:hypothetical protein